MNVNMKTAAVLLKKGYVVGFATDTVIGLATLPEYEYKLYQLKGRSKKKKIVLMINDFLATNDLKLMQLQINSWPGATTLICNLTSYRYPNSKHINELIKLVGSPLKVTSANYSGMPTAKTEKEFNKQFPNVAFLNNFDLQSKSNTPSQILLYNNSTNVIKIR